MFHSLVGIAAVNTSIASFMHHAVHNPTLMHAVFSFLGVFIGGVTFTGSLAAYRKLANMWPKEKMNLPYAPYLNKPIITINALAFALTCYNPAVLGTAMLT